MLGTNWLKQNKNSNIYAVNLIGSFFKQTKLEKTNNILPIIFKSACLIKTTIIVIVKVFVK